MKKFLSIFAFAVLCGCASNNPRATRSLPTQVSTPPAKVASKVSPTPAAVVPKTSAPVISRSAPVAAAKAPSLAPVVLPLPPKTLPAPVVLSAVQPAPAPAPVSSFFERTGKWAIVTILTALLSWAAYKYIVPIVKKFLAWVKTHNILASLDTLAKEAKTRIETDVKDIEKKL